jgi:sodium transport system ATP-binding protein
MVIVDNLTKVFRGSVLALDHVSFEAGPGEIFGIIGPNGAGKTTALRVLSTVLQPTSGTAKVAGFDIVAEAAEVRRRTGFQSATTGLYERLTAWEIVEFFGRLNGMDGPHLADRMAELFRQLEMNDFRNVPGGRMSTGMKQKVSLARALIHDPPVLIFDEPTAGLDVLVQRAVVQEIARLRDRGRCILFSTHIMREVEKLCDRVAILHRGRILAAGTLDELRHRHQQHDLEELFFQLIMAQEEKCGSGEGPGPGPASD